MNNRTRLRNWSAGFVGCLLAIGAVGWFIRPGNWAAWAALVLLFGALLCLTKVFVTASGTRDQDQL